MSPALDLYAQGLLALLISLGLGGVLGGMLAMRRRFEWGMAYLLLCLALGSLGSAVRLGVYAHLQSAVIEQLMSATCEEHQVGHGDPHWWHTQRFEALQPDGKELHLRLPYVAGRCPAAVEPPPAPEMQRLRYAKEAARQATEARADNGAGNPNHSSKPAVLAEVESNPRQPWVMLGVLIGMGLFGLLAGLFVVSSAVGAGAMRRGKPRRHRTVIQPKPKSRRIIAAEHRRNTWLSLVLMVMGGCSAVAAGFVFLLG